MIHANRYLAMAWVALALAGCATTGNSQGAKPLSRKERVDLMLTQAAAAISDRDPVGALQLLTEAEALEPKSATLEHLRTLAFMQKNEPAEALSSARRAYQLDPQRPEIQNNYGKLLIDAGKLKEAEAPLLAAAGNHLYREAFKAQTNLGILYYRNGDETKALSRFEKAAEQAPDSACVAHYYVGHLRLKSGRFEEAIRSYDRASRMACASFTEAHYALGLAYERGGQVEQARKKFLEVTRVFPETEIARRALDRLKALP